MIQHFFEIIIDGVRKWRQENNNPRTFSNVKIWASRGRHGFPPADAYIKHLEYENLAATTTNLVSVSCGNHNAASCSECPQGHGAGWCNGDCVWLNDECTTPSLPCPAKDTKCAAPDGSNVIMRMSTEDDADCGG